MVIYLLFWHGVACSIVFMGQVSENSRTWSVTFLSGYYGYDYEEVDVEGIPFNALGTL